MWHQITGLIQEHSFISYHDVSFLRKKVFDVFESNKKYIQQIGLEWLRTRMKLQNHGLENGRKVIK